MKLCRYNKGFNPMVQQYQVVVFKDGEWKPYYTTINRMDALCTANVFKSEHPDIPVKVITNK